VEGGIAEVGMHHHMPEILNQTLPKYSHHPPILPYYIINHQPSTINHHISYTRMIF